MFDCGSPEKEEQGGSVWEVMVAPPPAAAEQTNNYSSNSSSSRRSSGTRSSRDGGRGGTRSGSRAGSNLLVPSTGRQCNGGCAEAGASVELLFATDQVRVDVGGGGGAQRLVVHSADRVELRIMSGCAVWYAVCYVVLSSPC